MQSIFVKNYSALFTKRFYPCSSIRTNVPKSLLTGSQLQRNINSFTTFQATTQFVGLNKKIFGRRYLQCTRDLSNIVYLFCNSEK